MVALTFQNEKNQDTDIIDFWKSKWDLEPDPTAEFPGGFLLI